MPDAYYTIAAPACGEFRDQGSKFLGYAYPLPDEDTVQHHLQELKKKHPKARHYCYAYRIGLDGNNFRANDDGEPSGTAGRPILGQIDSFHLTNVILIVVRYFGGTLLGTSGLIHAYKTCARHTLEHASIVEKNLEDIYRLTFDYNIMGELMSTIKKLGLEILQQQFEETPTLQVAIRQGERENLLTQLKATIGKITQEEALHKQDIPGLKIEFLSTR